MDLNKAEKCKVPVCSIALYVAFSVVALFAVASLINDIVYFNNTVANYVAQGYPDAAVRKELISAQLLPGIFESIAVYGGIAFIIFGAGCINHRFSRFLTLLAKDGACHDTVEENVVENNIEKSMGVTERADTTEEVNEATDNKIAPGQTQN
ncbi:MAG: hypothetical protein PHO01_04585 [Desulfotomaculaceae bacterium]|nr:hypothetical protein [Desulfotomaculaceae bacterium]